MPSNPVAPVTRVLIAADPFAHLKNDVFERGQWPCSWIAHPETPVAPFVVAFRKTFSLERDVKIRAHVSADERYELFLDGVRVGRGSERGDVANWFFETYDFDLNSGDHILVARVWSLGQAQTMAPGVAAPFAQMSAKHGFLFAPETEEFQTLLGTGTASWDAKILGGHEATSSLVAWGTGANLKIHGDRFDWGFEKGEGENWQAAIVSHDASTRARTDIPVAQVLRPALLPPMMEVKRHVGTVRLVANLAASCEIATRTIPVRAADNLPPEREAWQALVAGASTLVVPPHTRHRVLLDLENYYCAYPEIETSGGRGSTVRVHWQEALYQEITSPAKGNRDEIEGKFFRMGFGEEDGVGDTFLPGAPSGSRGAHRRWSTLWWQCGRYLEIVVDTQDEALTLESFAILETRYPLEMESEFSSSDARLQETIPIMTRALQMCAHETYMDCPFYEQLQYIGDTRLEVLTTYVLTRDDRLPRKAIEMFDVSRLPEGLTQSRYPSRVRQIIPPFSLWWVAMLHDFALWRDDIEFVREKMKGARAVLDAFRSYQNADGLIEAPNGWNFCDWVRDKPGENPRAEKHDTAYWQHGIPPEGMNGVSGVLCWHVALVARQAAELEHWLGEEEMSRRHYRLASEVAAAASAHFWDEERGLFADDLKHEHWSEHSQCLALLSGLISDEQKTKIARGLVEDQMLARTTIYFSHYLFEAFREIKRVDKFFERMELWFALKPNGFVTTFEEADPNTTRSDCHAWGAHPLFHYFATLAGIRPQEFGFGKIQVAPQIGDLKWLNATLPHPKGEIKIALKHEDGVLDATIELPNCTTGEFCWNDHCLPLRAPCEELKLER